MIVGPADVLRKAISDLDPTHPGAAFRLAVFTRIAEVVELYWDEVDTSKTQPEGISLAVHQEMCCMTIAKALGFTMSGTIGFFQDKKSIENTIISLAIIIATCEAQSGVTMIPARCIVDAVHQDMNEDA